MGKLAESSRLQTPGMETNQGELARPPIIRYNIGDEDTELFSENRKPDNDVVNAVTEQSSLANVRILPPKQAEVFGFPQNVTLISLSPVS